MSMNLGAFAPGTNVALPEGVIPGQQLVFDSAQGPVMIFAPPNAHAGMQASTNYTLMCITAAN